MADFSLWDRETLEQFAQDAANKLASIRRDLDSRRDKTKPPCFGKWVMREQTNRRCDCCPVHLDCVKEQYGA